MLRKQPDLAELITDCARIIAFRNRLIHGYANITDSVVWGVLEANLQRLREEVTFLLSDRSEDDI